MFKRFSGALAVTALVLGGLGAAAVSGDRQTRGHPKPFAKTGVSRLDATVTTNRVTSTRSSASSRASARSSATAVQAGIEGDCAAEAVTTVEADGTRVTRRDFMQSINGHGSCRADAQAEVGSEDAGGQAN